MGKLIIIEAGDGSGKATQTQLLYTKLQELNQNVIKIEYPDYASPACEPVKMYLQGKFGGHADDVNAYAASTFFAVDRYASYRMKWKKAYDQGAIILADRYTTSNMVHQGVKIEDPLKRDIFLDWLWDTEFNKMGLPIPDKVIFLNVPPNVSDELIDQRAKRNHIIKDIHERDKAYLQKCHDVYLQMAHRYSWEIVNCVENNKLRTKEAIHKDIFNIVKNFLD